jgi:hypothetical protein
MIDAARHSALGSNTATIRGGEARRPASGGRARGAAARWTVRDSAQQGSAACGAPAPAAAAAAATFSCASLLPCPHHASPLLCRARRQAFLSWREPPVAMRQQQQQQQQCWISPWTSGLRQLTIPLPLPRRSNQQSQGCVLLLQVHLPKAKATSKYRPHQPRLRIITVPSTNLLKSTPKQFWRRTRLRMWRQRRRHRW